MRNYLLFSVRATCLEHLIISGLITLSVLVGKDEICFLYISLLFCYFVLSPNLCIFHVYCLIYKAFCPVFSGIKQVEDSFPFNFPRTERVAEYYVADKILIFNDNTVWLYQN